ncbi:DUF3999 domain-containing protein [Thermomonas sp.]|uniref:DUF3999 domain-containing protein n=1 Tax=Thermomonas sp. TaxID=1971895 RepID=UPI002486D221|nr:DUF3999 domain-containing protein [Thermomonas sp.]MDI1251789.1 DUF3999 domain-containing protein [Thermomonas sp.]
MKRLLWLTLLPALIASAQVETHAENYARQWPLALQSQDAGAYRVVLDREVYRSATLSSLRDIDVRNAAGAAVPAALFSPEQPLAQASHQRVLPWYPLPRDQAAPGRDITLISERDADGSLRRVEAHVGESGKPGAEPTANAWLIDASQIDARIKALHLDWPAQASALDVAYQVEGSDNLRDWRILQPRAQLLDLTRDGQRLQQRRIPLDGQAKYLRLSPLQTDAVLPLAGVTAELATPAAAETWQWEALRGHEVVENGRTYYQFTLDGRFPIARADVALDANAAGEWTLESRDADDGYWQRRAGPWMAFQVGAGDGGLRSAEQSLAGIARDHQWRLSSRAPINAAPVLRLGYQPEVMVFLAQGQPPFALVAGSARATRADAPLPQLVEAIRARRGADWQPATATLGAPAELSGAQALQPVPAQRDWKSWLLWGLLVLGAVLVTGFATSLLRQSKTP